MLELSNFGYSVVLYKMKQCILGLSRTARIFSFFPFGQTPCHAEQNENEKQREFEHVCPACLVRQI